MTAAPAGFQAAARLVRAMTHTYLALAATLFLLGLGLYTTEIVLRYGFRTGIPEYYELVGIGFIWVFLLGAAALYARNEDITIDLLHARLPERARPWLQLAVQLAVAVTMAVVAWYGWDLARRQWRTPTPLLKVSEAVRVAPLVLASASIVLSSLVEAWAALITIQAGRRVRVWPHPFFDQETEPEEGDSKP
jgi:TRAP-type C4-dicarboxylate transport system permease small subunit